MSKVMPSATEIYIPLLLPWVDRILAIGNQVTKLRIFYHELALSSTGTLDECGNKDQA